MPTMTQTTQINPDPISISMPDAPDAVPVAAGPLETVPALDRLPYLVRLGSVHALLIPVIWGTALAWWQLDRLDVWVFLLSLVGAGSLYLATHAFAAYFDHRRTQQRGQQSLPDLLIRPEPTLIYLTDWGDVLSVGWLLLIFGGLTTGLLTYLAGWPVLFFGGLSAGIALAYAIPPIQFGYGSGAVGEIGPLVAFGYLPVLTSFYAQSGTLTPLVLWAALPVALLVALVGLYYQLISWRQDWRLRKRTPVVILQPQLVLDIGAVVIGVGFAGVLVLVGTSQLPAWSLLGLGALPLALGPYSHVRRNLSTHRESVALLRSTIATTATMGLLLTLALWLDK